MTKVRKKAMGSYLEKEKKPKNSAQGQRSRLQSEDSTGSRASVGSDQQDVPVAHIPNSEVLQMSRGQKRSSGRPSSPIRSPGSSSHDGQAASPDNQKKEQNNQLSRVRHAFDNLLPSAPIVRPMRTNVTLVYDETAPGPFQSIGRPLDPFRTMFQAHHPRISVEELKFHCMLSVILFT